MGRGLFLEGIDISFGLSLPGEGGGWNAAAAPQRWGSAAAPGWDGAAAPQRWGTATSRRSWGADATPLSWNAGAAPLNWETRVAPLSRILENFLPDEGFSTAELPIEALADKRERRGSLFRGDLGEVLGLGGSVRDFCLRLGQPFVDPDCLAGPYRAAVAQSRAVYSEFAVGATTSSAVVHAAEAPAAGIPAAGASQTAAVPDPAISAFLLEFPLGFAYGTRERRHLDRLVRDLEGLPLAIAFYNPTWYSLRVIEALREKNIGLCLMDFPFSRHAAGMANDTAGLASVQDLPAQAAAPPRFDMATSSLVYLKFHGFSPARAAAGELEARFASWIPRLEALALQAQTLRIVFQGEGG